MAEASGSNPGSQVYWVVSDVAVAEIYEAAQCLASWTVGMPEYPSVGALREQYWRNRIAQVILGAVHGVVLDHRTDLPMPGGGRTRSSIEGVAIIEVDPADRDRATVFMVGTPDVQAVLAQQVRGWASDFGKQVGSWRVERTWVPL